MAKDREVFVDKDFQDLFLNTNLGPKVLGKLLDHFEFFKIAKDEAHQEIQNHLKIILSWTGIGHGLKGEKFIMALKAKKLITDSQFQEDNDGDE